MSDFARDSSGVSDVARKSFSLAMMEYLYSDIEQLVDDKSVDLGVRSRLRALLEMCGGKGIDSPIEHQLGAALLWLNIDWAGFPCVDLANAQHANVPELRFFITPQAKVKNYKVDFLVWFSIGRHQGGISVECDGHDFHEKTKEQAARDKKRDRELLTAGFPVMRFSGSEIHKDVLACAQHVAEALPNILWRVSKDGGLF